MIITITRQAGPNAIINGLFFDPAATVGATSQLAVSASTTVTAGSPFSVTVTAKDSNGNVATGYTGTVHFTSSDLQAGLPANYMFVAGDHGTHTFSVTLKTAGTQYIKATDTVTSTITGTQSGIVVQPASAQSLVITGFPATVTAGVANNFTVTLYDAYSNVATGYTGTVHFTSTDSSATLPANYTFMSGNAGTQSFSATLQALGTQTITATDTVTSSITGSASTTVNSSTGTASFVKKDTTTQGNWMNAYGTQGYDIISEAVSIPSYATVTPAGQTTYTWTTTSSDPRALQTPGSSNRVAAAWYSATSFTIAVNLSDGQAHDIALYALDWDNKGRGEQIQISSTAGGAILDTESISSFSGGEYLQWNVTGNVIIKVTKQAGPNGIISGLFFDPPTAVTPASASFTVKDTTTQGNWINVYGNQGYDIVSGAVSIPSYATVNPAGQTTYTWTTTSSDPRALQTPGSSNRVAAAWYSATSFTIAVNLTDGQAHDIALYALDWDNKGRGEQIQISSAASGAILDTESISNFSGGAYLQWKVTGNVIITVTKQAGVNAVISGLFFDPPTAGKATPSIPSTPRSRRSPRRAWASIHWQTPVDLDPQYNGNDLLIHYGSPLVTAANTVIVPVKTGATGGFEVQAISAVNGASRWTLTSDYALMPAGGTNGYDWTPSYSPTLTPSNRLYFAGDGGTVEYTDSPDAAGPNAPAIGRLAFFGLANYNANPAAYNSTVFINTPITSDAAGDIFFGFLVTGSNPLGLTSGVARIGADGTGSFAAGGLRDVAGGDQFRPGAEQRRQRPLRPREHRELRQREARGAGQPHSGRPGAGRLSWTRTTRRKTAVITNDGTASPTVGPDGDVYIGVLENPFASNHDRGWLLHFSGDLSTTKTPGAFGWDDTPSIVPASMVPSYHGTLHATC